MTKVVGIRFERAGKIYYFATGELDLSYGDRVIVESSRGQDMGTVVTPAQDIDEAALGTPLRPVLRLATPNDEQRKEAFKAKEPEAYEFCLQQIEAFNLPMKLIRAEYSFDGSRLVFYFSANGRVDFRELVKALAARLHTRIELRQIGVRDEARLVGGYSSCGRELCCASFLENFRPVSIKMAKQQNIALNPAKISGVCGRLMCCLSYEKDTEDEMECRRCKAAAAADNQQQEQPEEAAPAPNDTEPSEPRESREPKAPKEPKAPREHKGGKPRPPRETKEQQEPKDEKTAKGSRSRRPKQTEGEEAGRGSRPRPRRSPRGKAAEKSGEGEKIVAEE